jgi:hypothetical protein
MAGDGERGSGGREGGGPSKPQETSAQARGPARAGVEALYQEFVRRAAALGLSGFVLTEEAVRRAFGDVVPKDWVKYATEQSSEMRRELMDRIAQEFGAWLRELDTEKVQRTLLQTLLDEYDFAVNIEISAKPRDGDSRTHLELVPRRK